jgi:hypothetical protein
MNSGVIVAKDSAYTHQIGAFRHLDGHLAAIEWRKKPTSPAAMPKTTDYPRASLARTLELAAAIEDLGGECAQSAAAARLGAKPGGTFGALVSTAVKYGWIAVRRGRLRAEPRFRDFRLAYDEDERRVVLADAIRTVPLFRQLLERFAGRALPESHLAKLLQREYGVPERGADRVARHFVEALTIAGMLSGTRVSAASRSPARSRGAHAKQPHADRATSEHDVDANGDTSGSGIAGSRHYRVRVWGPDVDSTVEIATPEDVDLVRTLLAKVERGLRERARGVR